MRAVIPTVMSKRCRGVGARRCAGGKPLVSDNRVQLCNFVLLVKPLSCSAGEQADKINDADIMKHAAVHGKVKNRLTLCRWILDLLELFNIIKKIRLLRENRVTQDSSNLADHL